MAKESAELWNDAAKSLEFQQNYEGAATCYELARGLGDESSETLLNLAVSYMELYNFYKQDKYLAVAKDYLISGIDKDARSARLHHYLGLVYLALGEKQLAVQEFFSSDEISSEESNELLLRFDLPIELPQVYEGTQSDVYELLPDPALYKVFDLVKGFPADSTLLAGLKETYGDKDSASLTALYLRSIYFKVFEDKGFATQLGLLSDQAKWEALLVFFVRGINAESKALVKDTLKDGRLDLAGLPAYTRLIVARYRRDILSAPYSRESFKALILLPLRKLEVLDSACELARVAAERGDGAKEASAIFGTLEKTGFMHNKGGAYSISEGLLSGFEGSERLKKKLSSGEFDRALFLLLHSLLKAKRFEYALELAKKIRVLYDASEATSYVKEVLSKVSLSQDEKFSIFSEI